MCAQEVGQLPTAVCRPRPPQHRLICTSQLTPLHILKLYTTCVPSRIADRQPQAEFKRTLLCIDEIETSLVEAIASARSLNPSVRVVLTVSPVRHWREGPVESSRSKAHLLAAAHNACEQAESTVYFPSYELLMDELRD